jgi:quercetin dioxygenase-like cupin family protein
MSHTRVLEPVISARHSERTEAMQDMKKLILSVFVFTFGFAAGTHAQQVDTLLTKRLPEAQGKEIEVFTVNYAPGAADAIHRHHAHAVVYVIDGEVEMQVRGGTLQRLGPGQVFYESPEDVHTVSRNASNTKPATFVVFIIKNEGAPILTPIH